MVACIARRYISRPPVRDFLTSPHHNHNHTHPRTSTTSYKHTKRSIMTCIGKKGTGENEGREYPPLSR